MNGFVTSAAILSVAILLSGPAQAMEIRQFDKMADQDQSEYIGNLIVGAENALIDEGKPNLAAQIKTLFTTKNDPGDAGVLGMLEFEMNLAQARVVDAQRAEQDPKAHRLEVEDAMLVTLQKNNIPMARTFVKASGRSTAVSNPPRIRLANHANTAGAAVTVKSRPLEVQTVGEMRLADVIAVERHL